MKPFIIISVFILLFTASTLKPQERLHLITMPNDSSILVIVISENRDSVLIKHLDDTQKWYNWNDIKWYDFARMEYVKNASDLKPIRDIAYKLTDKNGDVYYGMIIKDTSNYMIFLTLTGYRIFKKTNINKIEIYPVEIRDHWLWEREPCDDRLILSHNGKIPKAGTFDLSFNELIIMGFFGYSITDWCQVSLQTGTFIKPLGLNIRFGKELVKNLHSSIGILNFLNNNEVLKYKLDGKFTYNNAVVNYINTYQFRNVALTGGIYMPVYTNNYNTEPFVKLFSKGKPAFTCGFNWRPNFLMSFINENIFAEQNYFSIAVRFGYGGFYMDDAVIYIDRGIYTNFLWFNKYNKTFLLNMFNIGFSF
ncbi:MAG: hypothetical protein ABSG15_11500 [FCB group bacterium]|jgi:hypothetical protein